MRFSLLAFPAVAATWGFEHFSDLVVFGNSYADESRWNYFVTHNGSAPPLGWEEPVSNNTASGGYIWPYLVSNSTGINLVNYAVSGATCSNVINLRIEPITNQPYPSVLEYQVLTYMAESQIRIFPSQTTVYSIWIGTNDLGYQGFLTDSQTKNCTVSAYTDCVYNVLDHVYSNGGRHFVLMNLAPLHLSPLYGMPGHGGVTGNESSYWLSKPENITEVSGRMKEQVVALNQVFAYRTPFELFVAKRYPGASFAVMDMYGLISDIYYHPSTYPKIKNVTGFVNHCDTDQRCTRLPNPHEFLWFDELHPSEQTDRIIAKEFIEVVKGQGKWASYW